MAEISTLTFDVDSSGLVEATERMNDLTDAVERLADALDYFRPKSVEVNIEGPEWLMELAEDIMSQVYDAAGNGRVVFKQEGK